MSLEVIVFKTGKKDLLYLYVSVADGLTRVPEALLTEFGEPEEALTFELTADRRMAREDPEKVLANIKSQGYHLQLPPPPEVSR